MLCHQIFSFFPPFFFISSMKDERTALMMAAQGGHMEVVNALVEAGADVNLGTRVCYLGMAYVSEPHFKSAY